MIRVLFCSLADSKTKVRTMNLANIVRIVKSNPDIIPPDHISSIVDSYVISNILFFGIVFIMIFVVMPIAFNYGTALIARNTEQPHIHKYINIPVLSVCWILIVFPLLWSLYRIFVVRDLGQMITEDKTEILLYSTIFYQKNQLDNFYNYVTRLTLLMFCITAISGIKVIMSYIFAYFFVRANQAPWTGSQDRHAQLAKLLSACSEMFGDRTKTTAQLCYIATSMIVSIINLLLGSVIILDTFGSLRFAYLERQRFVVAVPHYMFIMLMGCLMYFAQPDIRYYLYLNIDTIPTQDMSHPNLMTQQATNRDNNLYDGAQYMAHLIDWDVIFGKYVLIFGTVAFVIGLIILVAKWVTSESRVPDTNNKQIS